ncbi:hypothetical protein CHS0354_029262 [Potamilus streckersoni]|uniref:ADAMTS-like protein 1 n=1 Tax=Potamilus streckersoni TaxID=2493646 RepID=A0AAE0T033_9BIVA|nr:hypothetical protein CHS0354_029262 [Potamilus streckersoni]
MSSSLWFLWIELILLAPNPSDAAWSEWGPYEECSRPCGVGLANRTRTCEGDTKDCKGGSIRFKLCNTQPCDEQETDLRKSQCTSYNNVSLHGNYYQWVPHHVPTEPCALYCRTTETGVILKIQPMVINGTACGAQNRGVCVSGRCRRVGCDGVVGSRKTDDICGVCGGNGESCTQKMQDLPYVVSSPEKNNELFRWDIQWKACSVTCGTGTQLAVVVCIEKATGESRPDHLCDSKTNPHPQPRPCMLPECQYRWLMLKWSGCSTTCAAGLQHRKVACVDTQQGQGQRQVKDSYCNGDRPESERSCDLGPCPVWLSGPWTKCSGFCDYGTQKRKVICNSKSGAPCNPDEKPASKRSCYTGHQCENQPEPMLDYQQDDDILGMPGDLDDLFRIARYSVGEWSTCSVTCGSGIQTRTTECKIPRTFSKQEEVVPDSQCKGLRPHNEKPCQMDACPKTPAKDGNSGIYSWWVVDSGECNVTCGTGYQSHRIDCIKTKEGIVVAEVLCSGIPKPQPVLRQCSRKSCPPRWRIGEYSECSAKCGGGIQRRLVECVQDQASGEVTLVQDFRCPHPLPAMEQACNLHFCQTQWLTGDWSECSVTCGLGTQVRSVYCVKMLSSGQQINISELDCFETRSTSSRTCDLGDCLQDKFHLPSIKVENDTFIQYKRTKKVLLNVGEKAILLPNQSVKIRCPVKNYHRKLIFWTKDNRLIPIVGRIRVSPQGVLKITRSRPHDDKGIYTCIAGFLQASIRIDFQSKKEAKNRVDEIVDNLSDSVNHNFINRPQNDEMSNTNCGDNSTTSTAKKKSNSVINYADYTTSEWSMCSTTCGSGVQTRNVTCSEITDRYIRILPESRCEERCIDKPASLKKCIVKQECPRWEAENWSECSSKFCIREGFSIQNRVVTCAYQNGTTANASYCNKADKIDHTRECMNKACVAVWQTSRWSQCHPHCRHHGQKVRSLSCVWAATKLPAQDECSSKSKPPVHKPCKPTCNTECTDESNFCSLVGRLKMCRFHKFRRKCCSTCNNNNTLL